MSELGKVSVSYEFLQQWMGLGEDWEIVGVDEGDHPSTFVVMVRHPDIPRAIQTPTIELRFRTVERRVPELESWEVVDD